MIVKIVVVQIIKEIEQKKEVFSILISKKIYIHKKEYIVILLRDKGLHESLKIDMLEFKRKENVYIIFRNS